jgi:hypothetical protein
MQDTEIILQEVAAAVTELFLSSDDGVRGAIETGFLEHVLERCTSVITLSVRKRCVSYGVFVVGTWFLSLPWHLRSFPMDLCRPSRIINF